MNRVDPSSPFQVHDSALGINTYNECSIERLLKQIPRSTQYVLRKLGAHRWWWSMVSGRRRRTVTLRSLYPFAPFVDDLYCATTHTAYCARSR